MTARESIDITLVGGARDGEELTIQASEWLVMPRLADVNLHASFMQVTDRPPVADVPAFERDVYRRDVISDRTHRWRYVLERP